VGSLMGGRGHPPIQLLTRILNRVLVLCIPDFSCYDRLLFLVEEKASSHYCLLKSKTTI